jgi:hypothetical protein
MQRGSFYLETVVALFILTVMGTSLLPALPQLLRQSREAKVRANLVFLANYVGNYVVRWSAFAPDDKPIAFESYTEGVELESFLGEDNDYRVNRLFWADPLVADNPEIDNNYKVSIRFFETTDRVDSAVINIRLWYDENANDEIDTDEKQLTFSTMLTEKRLAL